MAPPLWALALILGDWSRPALGALGGLVLALLLALAFVVAAVGALFTAWLSPFAGLPGGAAPLGTAYPGQNLGDIPPDQRPVMQAAAATWCPGLPWQVLAGIARVESDFGANMSTSSAGAIGYGQFLPSSWAAYGNGGNPYDYHDALPAMARYLCASGAPGNLYAAIYAYNHADWYVRLVLSWAARYGYA